MCSITKLKLKSEWLQLLEVFIGTDHNGNNKSINNVLIFRAIPTVYMDEYE